MPAFVFSIHSDAAFSAGFVTLLFADVSFFTEDLVAKFTAFESIC